ncbi:MAG: hypothetical protein AAF962_04200 [Actinomycetota bacterium]
MTSPNPLEGAQEIQQMVVGYAKQETVEPLKSLGRYLGFGIAGSLFVFLGAFFFGLGLLRLMQSLEVFSGSSWASSLPYVIAMAALLLILVLIYSAMSRARKKVR